MAAKFNKILGWQLCQVVHVHHYFKDQSVSEMFASLKHMEWDFTRGNNQLQQWN